MSTSFYVHETRYKNPRKCTVCNIGIVEGYLHENVAETYCSRECLYEFYGETNSEDLLEFGDVFWTTWYDEIEVAE